MTETAKGHTPYSWPSEAILKESHEGYHKAKSTRNQGKSNSPRVHENPHTSSVTVQPVPLNARRPQPTRQRPHPALRPRAIRGTARGAELIPRERPVHLDLERNLDQDRREGLVQVRGGRLPPVAGFERRLGLLLERKACGWGLRVIVVVVKRREGRLPGRLILGGQGLGNASPWRRVSYEARYVPAEEGPGGWDGGTDLCRGNVG